jgi:hypothetical protein
MTNGLGSDDRERARRIALGLDPRASSGLPFAPGTATGSDGRERVYTFDKRTGQIQLVDQAGPSSAPMPPQVPQQAQQPTIGGGIVLDDQTLQSLMRAPPSERAAMLAAMQGGGQTFHPGANGEAVAGPTAGLSAPGNAGAFVSPDPIQQTRDKAYAGEVGRVQGERDATTPQRQQGMEGSLRGIDETMASVDRAINQVPGFGTTGFAGAVTSKIPGTQGYDLRKTIETVKANLGFDRLQAMREASPTGGALGQVAVQELEFLQAAVASLDQGQSDAQLLGNLRKVRMHYGKWKDAVKRAAQQTGLQAPPQSPQRPNVEWVRGPDGKLTRKG